MVVRSCGCGCAILGVLERQPGLEPGSSARFVQRLYPLSYCRYLCGC